MKEKNPTYIAEMAMAMSVHSLIGFNDNDLDNKRFKNVEHLCWVLNLLKRPLSSVLKFCSRKVHQNNHVHKPETR